MNNTISILYKSKQSLAKQAKIFENVLKDIKNAHDLIYKYNNISPLENNLDRYKKIFENIYLKEIKINNNFYSIEYLIKEELKLLKKQIRSIKYEIKDLQRKQCGILDYKTYIKYK